MSDLSLLRIDAQCGWKFASAVPCSKIQIAAGKAKARELLEEIQSPNVGECGSSELPVFPAVATLTDGRARLPEGPVESPGGKESAAILDTFLWQGGYGQPKLGTYGSLW